jgi:GNAT superfamily N-acetyltransferase
MIAAIDDAITLPDAPTVPGLVFRRFRGASDYPGLTAAGNATREADGAEWVLTVDDIAREYAHLVNSDPATDMIIAEIDGAIAGFTRGEWWREDSGLYLYWFSLPLAPQHRGRDIRRAMLHWVEARLRQVAAEHPAGAPKTFATWASPKADSLIVLLEDEGYRPARYFNKMTRSLKGALPNFPMPAGLEMRPVLPEHYRLIWEADNEAFRDHWGHAPAEEAYYQEWLEDPVIFTPELWQIAWDVENNEIAGQVRTFIDALENEKHGRQRGYTEFISVRRPYRKRGLARALIAESLRVLQARGMTESALTVDTENLTGATRLYEDCGFKAISRSTAYRKPL